jgi:outer membrane lipopolysaccharide assembly protein LptE/RlpB
MAQIARPMVIGLLVLCVGLAGCGYQFGGGGTLLPQDAQTIFVESFVNRTREVGVAQELTTAVRSELYRRSHLRLVDNAEQADLILSGVVRSMYSQTSSINRHNEALQFEAHMVLDVALRRRDPNELVWRGPGLKLSQVYAGSRAAVVTTSSAFRNETLDTVDVSQFTDIQLTETQQSTARNQMMERFAVELYQRLMEMF